jgi:hypothetical protein
LLVSSYMSFNILKKGCQFYELNFIDWLLSYETAEQGYPCQKKTQHLLNELVWQYHYEDHT